MKVAVASQNGVLVHQHFGRATQFLVYEIEGAQFRHVDTRPNTPSCGTAADEDGAPSHSPDPMSRTVDLVRDCRAVVVAQIGPGAVEKLSRHGVLAFVIHDYIDSALTRLIASGRLSETVLPGETQFRWLEP